MSAMKVAFIYCFEVTFDRHKLTLIAKQNIFFFCRKKQNKHGSLMHSLNVNLFVLTPTFIILNHKNHNLCLFFMCDQCSNSYPPNHLVAFRINNVYTFTRT